MQKKAGEKCRDNVAESGRGQNVREIGPGERGEIGIKETCETQDAEDHPGIDESVEDVRPVGEVDLADVVHATLEHDVASAVAACDGQIDQGFFELHSRIRPTFKRRQVVATSVNKPFPHYGRDNGGQAERIADDTRLADLFLFFHKQLQ